MAKNKQIYVLTVHPESCSVFIVTEQEWDYMQTRGDINAAHCEEIGRYDDIDFAEYDGEQYAKKHNCDFTPYDSTGQRIRHFVDEDDVMEFDIKTRVKLQFDLKFCGNAYVNQFSERIDPVKVKLIKDKQGNIISYEYNNE